VRGYEAFADADVCATPHSFFWQARALTPAESPCEGMRLLFASDLLRLLPLSLPCQCV